MDIPFSKYRMASTAAFTFLIAMSTLVTPVSADDTSTGCITLKSSKSCPSWDGNQILLADGYYSDQDEFDAFIRQQYDNNDDYISKFKSSYGCPNYDGHGQRYHISYYCSLMVYASVSSCSGSQPAVTMCRDTCNEAADALTSVFSDTGLCSSSDSITSDQLQSRNKSLLVYSSFCNTLSVDSTSNDQCLDGTLKVEKNTCGYFFMSDAKAYCATTDGSSDSCCKHLGTSSNGKVIAIAVVVSLVVVFLIGILLWCCIRRRRRQRNETNSVYDVSQLNNPFRNNTSSTVSSKSSPSVKGKRDTPQIIASSKVLPPISPASPVYSGPVPRLSMRSPIPQDQTARDISVAPTSAAATVIISPQSALTYKNGISLINTGTIKTAPISPNTVNESLPSPPPIPIVNPGDRMEAWARYSPKMPDEVQLNVGDIVVIEMAYDDGWARGKNLTNGMHGAFPVAALISPGSLDRKNASKGPAVGSRHSSIYSPAMN